MRKKIRTLKYLLITICIILLLIMPTVVQAYSGEIDPKNYIHLPYSIDRETGGTITINSAAGTGYTVYYQYEFITSTQSNQLSTAMSEYNQDVEEYNNTVRTLEAERNAAYDEYERLREDANATEEQINEAYENYENIVESTKQLINSKKNELEEKLASVYELYPTYTEANWEEAVNNKVLVDVSQYSGEVHYILWVKLVNSEGTYYDVGHYSSIGTKEITLGLNKLTAEIEVGNTVQLTATTDSTETVTWTSNKENIATVNSSGLVTGVAEGVATITAEVEGKTATCTVTVKEKKQNTEEDGLTWTDFSNAKVRLVRKDYRSDYYIVVSDATFDMDTSARYDIYFSTDKNSVPDIKEENSSAGWKALYYEPNSKHYNGETELGKRVDKSQYELSGDKIYVWVRERQKNTNGVGYKYKMQLSEFEVERLPQSPIGTRIIAYFFDDETSTFLWDYYDTENKNVKYKIGRVTDTNLLKAIKNGEAGCLDKLMTYAKNASNGYTGSCKIGDSESITNKLGLVDSAYYYAYLELDTENGKYYPIEDVSLYQASCYHDIHGEYIEHLLNYLDDEFVWNLSDEPSTPKEPEDNTTSTGKLPNTGKTIVITIMIVSSATIGVVSYKKYKNLNIL